MKQILFKVLQMGTKDRILSRNENGNVNLLLYFEGKYYFVIQTVFVYFYKTLRIPNQKQQVVLINSPLQVKVL